MAAIFGAQGAEEAAEHATRCTAASSASDGPPATGFELNGWGDDLVHDYLKGIEIDGRLGVLYSNKDYGCEWDYDWRNKRFLAEDNTTIRGQHRDLCDDQLGYFLTSSADAWHGS